MRPTRNTLDPARLPPLLTTEQAAELLGVHVVTLRKWAATGKIAAHKVGLGVNAGHDLSLENLAFFSKKMPYLNEVSIGHALISDALYLGLEETIKQYKNCLK